MNFDIFQITLRHAAKKILPFYLIGFLFLGYSIREPGASSTLMALWIAFFGLILAYYSLHHQSQWKLSRMLPLDPGSSFAQTSLACGAIYLAGTVLGYTICFPFQDQITVMQTTLAASPICLLPALLMTRLGWENFRTPSLFVGWILGTGCYFLALGWPVITGTDFAYKNTANPLMGLGVSILSLFAFLYLIRTESMQHKGIAETF